MFASEMRTGFGIDRKEDIYLIIQTFNNCKTIFRDRF